jgi:hypothetical protein
MLLATSTETVIDIIWLLVMAYGAGYLTGHWRASKKKNKELTLVIKRIFDEPEI